MANRQNFIFFLGIIYLMIAVGFSLSLHQKNLLDVLDLQEPPKQADLSMVSPHALDIHKSYYDASVLGQKLRYSKSNTIRSFSSKDGVADRGHYFYNLNIPQHEEIVGAELDFFIPHDLSQLQHASEAVKVQLFELQENESTKLLEERIVPTKEFGWGVFNVKPTIEEWLDTPDHKKGFALKVLDFSGKELSSRIIHSLQGSNETVLTVFSNNPKASEANTLFQNVQISQTAENLQTSGNSISHSDTETARKIRSLSDAEENLCQLYKLRINFNDIGWSFIIYPESFEANFCKGACSGNLTATHHAKALYTAYEKGLIPKDIPISSCFPTQYQPTYIMYLDPESSIINSVTLPDMVASECGCST